MQGGNTEKNEGKDNQNHDFKVFFWKIQQLFDPDHGFTRRFRLILLIAHNNRLRHCASFVKFMNYLF